MEKRAQFYLIAALVIIGIVTGLTTVYTSSTISEEDRVVYDLSSEISYEATKMIDNGILHGTDDAALRQNITELVKLYATDVSSREEIVVVFGNKEKVKIITYILSETGKVCVSLGGSPSCFDQTESEINSEEQTPDQSGIVNVEIKQGQSYEFELQRGQNFFMILRKQDKDETYVASVEPGEGNIYLEPGDFGCLPQDGLIEICCMAAEDGNPQSIIIEEDSLQAHLDHGDYCGSCD